MKTQIVKTSSAEETTKLAADILTRLRPGDCLALTGDLGSGKTTFVKGLADALGVKGPVTSPTFLILKTYPTKDPAIKRLVHVDAYRLESADDLVEVGFSDEINEPGTAAVVEWAEKVKDALPASKTIWIKIKIGQKDDRIFEITWPNGR